MPIFYAKNHIGMSNCTETMVRRFSDRRSVLVCVPLLAYQKASWLVLAKMHAALIERSLGGRIVGVIARDATEIEAREKPAAKQANDKNDDPPPDGAQPPRKRGRPRKDEQRPKPEPTRLERQASQNVNQMLADLPTACDVGSKKNSKGYKETWIGYKLHIDVASGQIPVSCVLTSASVYDSQVAIPLMTMTGARVSYLYDLMDTAYDAAAIHARSEALGHQPIIDPNDRAQHETKAEWAKEVERMEFIKIPDPDDVIYDFRTMVERVNARLKDESEPGSCAYAAHQGQMPPHVRHRRPRRRSDTPRRHGQAGAELRPQPSDPTKSGKFPRSGNYARGSLERVIIINSKYSSMIGSVAANVNLRSTASIILKPAVTVFGLKRIGQNQEHDARFSWSWPHLPGGQSVVVGTEDPAGVEVDSFSGSVRVEWTTKRRRRRWGSCRSSFTIRRRAVCLTLWLLIVRCVM